jgi:hypothetical protein
VSRNSLRRPSSGLRLAAAAVILVLLTASVALARGGGGDNFGGGGGSGGHGGGGGGGGGALVWLLIQVIRLAIRNPPIGVPLLAVVLYLLWRVQKSGRAAYTGSVVRRGRSAIDVELAAAEREKIVARDPSFDPERFALRVRAAFSKVQDAWCAQDLTPIRPFVSDGVYERFTMQIEEQRALGYRDHMEGVRIDEVVLVRCEAGEKFDTATMRIAAVASDWRVSLETGERVAKSAVPERFVEFWTFVRRRGAKPLGPSGGLLEGHCPNCGDSVEGNQFADCRSCKSRLRSGEHDWVLVEITQASEWAIPVVAVAPGVAALTAADPAFCREEMEDRASVVFWRWATAMRLADAKPLAGVAGPDVIRAAEASFAAEGVARRYVGECGVGAVDLLGVLADPDATRAVVEVRWSGTEFESAPGGMPRRNDRTGVRASIFVFERAPGAKGRIADAFSSAHCGACGAPAEGSQTVCGYCSMPLADVSRGWTLTRIATRFEAASRLLLDRLRDARTPAPPPVPVPARPARPAVPPSGLVAWAARVAAADGDVDGRERAGILRLAERAQIPADRVDEIIRTALATTDAPPGPVSAHDARVWLDGAIVVVLSDGVVSKEEMAVLQHLGDRAGMSAADVRVAINRAKGAMYQEAKAALRRASAN